MTLCRSRPGASPSHESHSGVACKRFIGKACRDRALIWFGVTRGGGCPWWRSVIPSRMICLVPVCLAGLAHARKLTSCSGCLRQTWKLGILLLAVRPGWWLCIRAACSGGWMATAAQPSALLFKGASWQQWRSLEHLLFKSLLLCMRMPRGCYCRTSLRSCRSGSRPATGWQGRCNGEGLGSLALHGITWQGPSWRRNASESYRGTRVPWPIA